VYVGEYFSEILDRDYHCTIPDSGIGAIATISARAGGYFGFNGGAKVVLRTGAAYASNSSIGGQSSISYGTSIPVDVTIKDRWGNPLCGHLITLECNEDAGTITGSPRYTDSYGVASGFTFQATTNVSVTTGYLVAQDLDPNYGGIGLSKKVSFEE
jgi:opacity protein-like surface antigen